MISYIYQSSVILVIPRSADQANIILNEHGKTEQLLAVHGTSITLSGGLTKY